MSFKFKVEEGMLTVDNNLKQGNYQIESLGIQINGSQVWICVNGQSVLRFKEIDPVLLEKLKEIRL